MLLDQFGRPIQANDLKRPETREMAVALLRDRWSTYPSAGLTPQRLAQIFRQADFGDVYRQAELFEEMEEKDPHMASLFQTRKLAVQGLSWDVHPVNGDPQGEKIADFCRQAISGLENMDDHILDMLDALPKGYSMMEAMWDVSSGQAMITDLHWVHPKRITFWYGLTPRILVEENWSEGIDPPPFKFVYHRYKARSGHDTRAGILRVCAWMYIFKNYSLKDWAAFSEVYGMPLRVGKFEPGASQADKDALLDAIRSLGSDAAGIISSATQIEFIESHKTSGGAGQNIYEALIHFCNTEMSKAILGQTLTSDSGGTKASGGGGSYALGKVHAEVRQDLIEADCKALSNTFTRQIVRPLVGFNFGWDARVPNFSFLFEAPEDLAMLAGVYKILVAEIGQPVSEEHISERFKVPLPAKGETVVSPPQGATGAPLPNMAKLIAKHARSQGDPGRAWQSVLNELKKSALPDAASELEAMLKPVLELVRGASSLEEIGEKIFTLYPKLDTKRFQALLARAMFASAVTGAASEQRV